MSKKAKKISKSLNENPSLPVSQSPSSSVLSPGAPIGDNTRGHTFGGPTGIFTSGSSPGGTGGIGSFVSKPSRISSSSSSAKKTIQKKSHALSTQAVYDSIKGEAQSRILQVTQSAIYSLKSNLFLSFTGPLPSEELKKFIRKTLAPLFGPTISADMSLINLFVRKEDQILYCFFSVTSRTNNERMRYKAHYLIERITNIWNQLTVKPSIIGKVFSAMNFLCLLVHVRSLIEFTYNPEGGLGIPQEFQLDHKRLDLLTANPEARDYYDSISGLFPQNNTIPKRTIFSFANNMKFLTDLGQMLTKVFSDIKSYGLPPPLFLDIPEEPPLDWKLLDFHFTSLAPLQLRREIVAFENLLYYALRSPIENQQSLNLMIETGSIAIHFFHRKFHSRLILNESLMIAIKQQTMHFSSNYLSSNSNEILRNQYPKVTLSHISFWESVNQKNLYNKEVSKPSYEPSSAYPMVGKQMQQNLYQLLNSFSSHDLALQNHATTSSSNQS